LLFSDLTGAITMQGSGAPPTACLCLGFPPALATTLSRVAAASNHDKPWSRQARSRWWSASTPAGSQIPVKIWTQVSLPGPTWPIPNRRRGSARALRLAWDGHGNIRPSGLGNPWRLAMSHHAHDSSLAVVVRIGHALCCPRLRRSLHMASTSATCSRS
jgi:hypothetical protein